MKKRRFSAIAAALALTIGMLPTGFAGTRAKAAADSYKFDLGNKAQNGYISVSASEGYSASKGYGFSAGSGVKDVAASGSGALSDAVQFTSSTTFNVDLDKGLYRVKVILGNTSRTSVYMEKMLQIVNMTGNNAVDEILIPVTDGQLNIRAAAGKSGYAYTISAIEINKVSDDPTLPKTLWLCGDSTVCNYYPKATSNQAGWGQVIDQYLDSSWNVRNMAASGQYAKGFVDAGQFDAIEYYGKKGDIYAISIGINDTNYSNATEYYNVVTDMTKRAKKKGMEVILVKQQGRKGDYTKKPLLKSRYYAAQLDQIGKEQNVQVVDLFNLFQNRCVEMGASKADALYIDNVHPNRQGALVLAELFSKQVNWGSAAAPDTTPANTTAPPTTTAPVQPSELQDGAVYLLKNVNSGLYLQVEGGTAANSANAEQGTNKAAGWKAVATANGYYALIAQVGDGKTYALDISAKSTENGANVEIYTYKGGDNQQFKFVKQNDGSYIITTKITADESCIEVNAKSTEAGANIQQWAVNGGANQKWILEAVGSQPVQTTAAATTTNTTTTTTTTTIVTTPAPSNGVSKYGDVNVDGSVDVRDVLDINRNLLMGAVLSAQGIANADVDRDNLVTQADALMILKATIGLTILPEAPPAVTTQTTATTQTTQTTTTTTQTQAANLYYAADAAIDGGDTETVNEGFKGASYVNLNNAVGSAITWKLNAAQDGNYLISFYVANGTETDRRMKIEVNGGSDYWVQPFTTTGAWTQWAERGIVLPLKKGENTLKLTSLTENGGPNFDYLTMELTDEPIAEIYVPEQKPTVPDSDNPVIYIAGDSTVQSYKASYAPQQGWGYYLGNYFQSNVSVSNQAIAGRSSKSFYDNGRLDTILDTMKKGDYLLVQFGINDAASNKAERYAPVCGNVDKPTNGSFEYYMQKYIEGTLEKGGTPVLVTTVIGLKAYSGGKFVNSYTGYCDAMKKLAAKYKIPCIDLNSLMVSHYNSIGYDAAYKYHMCSTGSTDMTHFTETGANAVAKIVANAIKGLGLPVSDDVK